MLQWCHHSLLLRYCYYYYYKLLICGGCFFRSSLCTGLRWVGDAPKYYRLRYTFCRVALTSRHVYVCEGGVVPATIPQIDEEIGSTYLLYIYCNAELGTYGSVEPCRLPRLLTIINANQCRQLHHQEAMAQGDHFWDLFFRSIGLTRASGLPLFLGGLDLSLEVWLFGTTPPPWNG